MKVYRYRRRDDVLVIPNKDDFSRVPDNIKSIFTGPDTTVKEQNINRGDDIIGGDPNEILDAIENQGYFYQHRINRG